ncbi:MAG: PLP-dependent aminotransferase family protein [Candidatus Krumholzibacteria bacterium]|nr:PLP-dependent aminotransferase family protein [Candidatus Krumholzibacteria bacterium]
MPSIGPNKPLYAAIARALAEDIGAGRLRPGDELPTQRELADGLGVSVGTITRAYRAAERRGLIRGEIGRGTFVTGAPMDEYGAAEFEPTTPGVIDLAVVRPLYGLDPDLAPAMRELARLPALPELLHYQPNAGMRRHRAAGSQWVSRFGVHSDAENVIVCAGTQHALTVTLSTLCKPGDSLFVEELTYPGLRALANLLKLKMVPLPTDGDGLIPAAFESACRQRRASALFAMPTIHNPLTVTIPEARRREIAGIASKYGVAIIEDAINHLLADDPPPPLSVFAPEISYFIAAMSKVVTGGLRVAYLVAPKDSIDLLTRAVWATNWMTAPLCAEIATMWIENGTADNTLGHKRTEARDRVNIAREILDGFELRCNDFGHHAWLTLPDPWRSAAQFAEEARRRGVAVASADVFAVGGNPPVGVRLSLSAPPDREVLSAGLRKLKQVLGAGPGLGSAIV